ncbi:MAG: hypothetical protein KJ597_03390, partial [Nanoarchaeota archaeon]|nr:hypothetical protein [Nanoarchaeota archaeon]
PFIFIISWVFRGLVLAKDYVVDQHLGIGAYKSTFFLKDFLDPALGSMNLGEFITRFFVNVYQYSGAILLNDFQKIGLHSFSFFIPLVILLGTIFWIFVTIGFIKKFNKKSLLPFYILTYLFVILIDAWVTIRYLIPIIPFLIYYFVCGLQISIKKIFPKPLSKKMFLSIIMLITILSALGCVTEIVRQQREPYYQNEWYDFYQMSVWIEDNIQEGVFTSKKCATFYVWTNKKCSYHPLTADQSIMLNFLKIDRIDYIIVDNFSYNTAQRYLQPMIEKNKEHFQLIHQIGQTKLYKVKNKGS